jgi:hypothetical protein
MTKFERPWINEKGQDIRKCPKHNTWMKTNRYHPELGPRCERCLVEADAKQREYEKTGGSNRPPVRIKRI